MKPAETKICVTPIIVARVLNETDTLKKTGKTLIWGSHRPLHVWQTLSHQ
jgi:hypothetical protein